MEKLKNTIEKYAFGVCQHLADRMGIQVERVRLYFVYASFFTFGSPVIIYIAVAFWLNIKQYLRQRWLWNS